MSTDYRPRDNITLSEVFDGRLAPHGITEQVNHQTTEVARCLTDGNNFLWVYADNERKNISFTRYMPNGNPSRILAAIEEVFETVIYSEYEPQFWGFKTQEEWDAWDAAMDKEYDDKFHADIVRYVAGEPNGIVAGTIGETQARIAKQLIEADPSLAESTRKDDLLKLVSEIYDRDHAVRVMLSHKDMALADMMAAHEDDLPKA
jgi:phosphoribosyl-ATP pyrophosphohydrolase